MLAWAGWLKLKNLTIPSADEDAEQLKLSNFYKITRTLTTGIYPKETETYVTQKAAYKQSCSSIRNHQKLETTQMCFGGWLDKQTAVHPYRGVPLSRGKEGAADTCDVGGSHGHSEWKSPSQVTHCLIPFMQHSWKEENYNDREQMGSGQRWGARRGSDCKRKAWGIFLWWWSSSIPPLCWCLHESKPVLKSPERYTRKKNSMSI